MICLSKNICSALAIVLGRPSDITPWMQGYDPASHWWLSTIWAALPLVILLAAMIGLKLKGHISALLALGVAVVIAVVIFHMPVHLATLSTALGVGYGLFPIFWIVFPVIFMYQLTVCGGRFELLQECLVGVTEDSRLQLLLIAFIFGAFFEGAAGFGTPVAVCGTILLGLGFLPLEAAGLALLANTAPVAFGALGTPVIALHAVTGLDTLILTRVVATLLTPFCIIVPFWLIWAYAGFRAMCEVWPAILVSGGSFGFTQLAVARLHGPWLVDISAAVITMGVFVLFLRIWKPRRILNAQREDITHLPRSLRKNQTAVVVRAATPWLILTLFVTIWGTPHFTAWIDSLTSMKLSVPGLDHVVFRMPPVVPHPAAEAAVFTFNWLSATGSGIFLAAILAAFVMRLSYRDILRAFWQTVVSTRFTMITIAALMGLAFITRFCGMDATLGLAFARTGILYPFFGTLIGWLGTASTGSDTSTNVLFGSLQKFTAQQLGISPYIMASANSGGGVMGKMVAPQSVVVASTATDIYGSEGSILRFVFLHSFILACLMGVLVSVLVYFPSLAKLILI
ncbi:MAG: L-lactate permease [Edaphobacter sp.]